MIASETIVFKGNKSMQEFFFAIVSRKHPDVRIDVFPIREENLESACAVAECHLEEFLERYPCADVVLVLDNEETDFPKELEFCFKKNTGGEEINNSGFAFFPTFLTGAIKELVALAEDEDWEYHFSEENTENDVLLNYLRYTYKRIAKERKIAVSENKRYSCFHTGLSTKYNEPIYAFFSKNTKPNSAPWFFVGWRSRGEKQLKNISKLPEPASYFSDTSSLFFDYKKGIVLNSAHIVEENKDRFPAPFSSEDPQFLLSVIKGKLVGLKEMIRCNYKIAVPCYYRGKIHLLLPLYLKNPDRADMALAIEDAGDHYRAATCLTLEMAYHDARLVAKQDRGWLNP
ncbi:MAG: DUF3825 domain-containing protein [Candidatus Paceibacterota bacterium]|jgi:hypothetical protein